MTRENEPKAGSELKEPVRPTIMDLQRKYNLGYGTAKKVHDSIQDAVKAERERIIWELSADNEDAIPGVSVCRDTGTRWEPMDSIDIRAALDA